MIRHINIDSDNIKSPGPLYAVFIIHILTFFYNGKTVLFLKVSRLHSFVFCLLYSLRSSSLKNVLSIFPTAISNYADDIAVIGITHRFACETPKTISSIIIAFFLKHKCCASRKARGDKLVTSCLESQRHFYNC